MDNKFENEFEDKTKRNEENSIKSDYSQEKIRIKLPRGREVLGIIEQRLGGNKVRVQALDGKTRICRVPGRLRRHLWLRVDNVVIIEPWELDDTKGDVLFKYTPTQVALLRKKGYLDKEVSEF